MGNVFEGRIESLNKLKAFRMQTADLASGYTIGHVPNVASVSISQLSPKDLVNTDWRIFPISYKGDDDTVATRSDMWGIAYREIT